MSTADAIEAAIEAAISKASASFDEALEAAVERSEIVLRDSGATDEELGRELAYLREQFTADREPYLAALRRWIAEPDAPSVALQ